jgi:hypothetical protein
LSQAIQLNPNFADAYYYRGLASFAYDFDSSSRENQSTIADFTQVIPNPG